MYDIVHQLTIAATPDRVYEAVTTSEGLATWWTTDVKFGPGDGEFRLGFDNGAVRMRFQVDAFDPPVSVPIANPTSPATVAEAGPADDPLEPWEGSHGFLV